MFRQKASDTPERPQPEPEVFAKGPFHCGEFPTGGHIWALGEPERGHVMVAQIRGWGYLTGRGNALALDGDEAVRKQYAMQSWIVAAMNEKWERENPST